MKNSNYVLTPEYNAFGPWIYEVSNENPVPPLFLPYNIDYQECLLVIKIPRSIDRRDANPSMDLYDYVICMYEDYGRILERKEKEVEEIEFVYNQVEGIEDYKDLLFGRLTIYLENNTITIPYNTVSQDIISKLVKIIRNRYSNKAKEIPNKISIIEDDKITEILYENIINKMNKQEDNLEVMAFQPTINLSKYNNQLWYKLLIFIKSKLLLSTVHLADDRELLIISRGRAFKNRREAVYSYSLTYLPKGKINNIWFNKQNQYSDLTELNLSTHEHTFKYVFEEKNQELFDYYNSLIY